MKRADLDTRSVLNAVIEHGQIAGHVLLCESFPLKVVDAAFEREARGGRMDYGVTLRSAWVTPEGHRWLRDHEEPGGSGS